MLTAETHGVIGGADGAIGLALSSYELDQGPLSQKEVMGLSDDHGLSFKVDYVTGARNLLLQKGPD